MLLVKCYNTAVGQLWRQAFSNIITHLITNQPWVRYDDQQLQHTKKWENRFSDSSESRNW